jgi:aspartate-semialdehyde dehydrogenase
VDVSLAVVGATGNVGRIMVDLLERREFPARQVKFLASKRSAGTTIPFRGREHVIEELTPQSFRGFDLVVASTPDDIARDFLPHAVQCDCVVIDESGYFRMHPDVPLVIPEVNAHAITRHKGLISSPNCSTTQMVQCLKPLHDYARVRRVIVSTYQAASGAGLKASEELETQAHAMLHKREHPANEFAHQLAFNCIPHIGSMKDGGFTSEETKMILETRKMLEDDSIQVCPTCVRIPVTNCHSESIVVETDRKVTVEKARELFAATPGLIVIDDLSNKRYPMPKDCSGRDETFVGRIRVDPSHPTSIAFWCVSDNLRKGAATNAVQIAEALVAGWESGKIPRHAAQRLAAAATK